MVAPTLVGAQVSTGNVTTRAVTPGTAIPVGAVVFVSAHAGGSTDLSIADAQGNTWTAQTEVEVTSGALATTRTWVCKVTTEITGAITVTRSTSGGLAIMAASLPDTYSGTPVDPLTAFDNASTATHATAASTVPDGGGVVLMASTTNTGRTYTASAGTLLEQVASSGTGNPRVGGIAYIDTASAGSQRPILQPSTNNAFAASSVVIVPDAAPPDDVTGTAASTLPTLTQTIAGTVSAPATSAWPAIIGDSLTEREGSTAAPPDRQDETTALFVAAGFPGLLWYGDGGKPLEGTDSNGNTVEDVIDDHLAARGGPLDIWIIALGTNFGSLNATTFGNRMRAIIDYINTNGGGQILWPEITFYNPANTNAATFNPVIATVASEYDNVTVVPLNTILHDPHDDGDWIYPTDSTHMTAQGYARRDAALVEYALSVTAPEALTGTASSTLPALTQAAAGDTEPPAFTGTAASTLPSLTQTATGGTEPPTFTGTASSTLPPLSQVVIGDYVPPAWVAEVAQTIPSLTQEAAGTRTVPGGGGDVATVLPSLTQAAEGTVGAPGVTGTAVLTLPALTQTAVAESLAPTITGSIVTTLPALTQTAGDAGRDITLNVTTITLNPTRATTLTGHPMRVTNLEV